MIKSKEVVQTNTQSGTNGFELEIGPDTPWKYVWDRIAQIPGCEELGQSFTSQIIIWKLVRIRQENLQASLTEKYDPLVVVRRQSEWLEQDGIGSFLAKWGFVVEAIVQATAPVGDSKEEDHDYKPRLTMPIYGPARRERRKELLRKRRKKKKSNW